MMNAPKKVAIFGSGPGGLMAATLLTRAGIRVSLFERRPSCGRKLLIAGSSGLNISHEAPLSEFASHYQGFTHDFWLRSLRAFGPKEWIAFVQSLGFETFLGTSSRYFVREMKASNLLKTWVSMLKESGVEIIPNHEWNSRSELMGFDGVGFFLGGGSWEEHPPSWPEVMKREFQIRVNPFYSTNVGYEVKWSEAFLKEAEGKPLKNIVFRSSKGQKAGELMITRYGLEGTPIYFYGNSETITIDLKPSMSAEEIKTKLLSIRENLAPLRRVKKILQLCDASLALLFHHTKASDRIEIDRLVSSIKNFKITLGSSRPLLEAISSGGGVDLSEVSTEIGHEFELKKHPMIFCGGEMLDWTAPTGGFLIQASVTHGAQVANNMISLLSI